MVADVPPVQILCSNCSSCVSRPVLNLYALSVMLICEQDDHPHRRRLPELHYEVSTKEESEDELWMASDDLDQEREWNGYTSRQAEPGVEYGGFPFGDGIPMLPLFVDAPT